jgi:hypothetical protein
MEEGPWPILTGLHSTFLERGYPISETRCEWDGKEGEEGESSQSTTTFVAYVLGCLKTCQKEKPEK